MEDVRTIANDHKLSTNLAKKCQPIVETVNEEAMRRWCGTRRTNKTYGILRRHGAVEVWREHPRWCWVWAVG